MRLSVTIAKSKLKQEYAVSAARDTGSVQLDRDRRAALIALHSTATSLLEGLPQGTFPEVESAAATVRGTLDMAMKLEAMSKALKTARAGSPEAAAAQAGVDSLRMSVDVMVPVLQATVQSMVTLVQNATALEGQFAAAQARSAEIETTLKRERERLDSIAKAVQTAMKIG